MSAHTYLDSRFDDLVVSCDEQDPTVRMHIDHGRISIAMRLNLADIERMETALAVARMNLAAREARREAA